MRPRLNAFGSPLPWCLKSREYADGVDGVVLVGGVHGVGGVVGMDWVNWEKLK